MPSVMASPGSLPPNITSPNRGPSLPLNTTEYEALVHQLRFGDEQTGIKPRTVISKGYFTGHLGMDDDTADQLWARLQGDGVVGQAPTNEKARPEQYVYAVLPPGGEQRGRQVPLPTLIHLGRLPFRHMKEFYGHHARWRNMWADRLSFINLLNPDVLVHAIGRGIHGVRERRRAGRAEAEAVGATRRAGHDAVQLVPEGGHTLASLKTRETVAERFNREQVEAEEAFAERRRLVMQARLDPTQQGGSGGRGPAPPGDRPLYGPPEAAWGWGEPSTGRHARQETRDPADEYLRTHQMSGEDQANARALFEPARLSEIRGRVKAAAQRAVDLENQRRQAEGSALLIPGSVPERSFASLGESLEMGRIIADQMGNGQGSFPGLADALDYAISNLPPASPAPTEGWQTPPPVGDTGARRLWDATQSVADAYFRDEAEQAGAFSTIQTNEIRSLFQPDQLRSMQEQVDELLSGVNSRRQADNQQPLDPNSDDYTFWARGARRYVVDQAMRRAVVMPEAAYPDLERHLLHALQLLQENQT